MRNEMLWFQSMTPLVKPPALKTKFEIDMQEKQHIIRIRCIQCNKMDASDIRYHKEATNIDI